MYFRNLLPRLVEAGDDGNCGSAAVCDTLCLQVCHPTEPFLPGNTLTVNCFTAEIGDILMLVVHCTS